MGAALCSAAVTHVTHLTRINSHCSGETDGITQHKRGREREREREEERERKSATHRLKEKEKSGEFDSVHTVYHKNTP